MCYLCELDSEIDFENYSLLQSTYVKRWTLNKKWKRQTKEEHDVNTGTEISRWATSLNWLLLLGLNSNVVATVATKQMFSGTKPPAFSKDDWKNLSQWNEIFEDIVHS